MDKKKIHSQTVFYNDKEIGVMGVMHSRFAVFNGMLWSTNLHETMWSWI